MRRSIRLQNFGSCSPCFSSASRRNCAVVPVRAQILIPNLAFTLNATMTRVKLNSRTLITPFNLSLPTIRTQPCYLLAPFPIDKVFRRDPQQSSNTPLATVSDSHQNALTPSRDGTCPTFGTCLGCSKVRRRSTETSRSGKFRA